MPNRPPGDGAARFGLLYVLPVLVLIVACFAPLIAGVKTLYLRDVFHTHLEMKVAGAFALRRGTIPLVDPLRAGGQPYAGNPNALPFYPDNLLYLTASPLWALNAHFWLHLLLALPAFYAMARALGLGREGAWAAAVFYALSGYVLSQLSFYNLIAGSALAPALVAACLRLATGRRPGLMLPAVAGLWALLLTAGDPFTALVTLGVAACALAYARGGSPGSFGLPAAGLACGTLVAAPQLVEFLRIVGTSYRGHAGYSSATLTLTSFHPVQLLEWILPFVLGRPDLLGPGGFTGERFYTGRPPYFFSLYPGLLVLALLVASAVLRGRVVRFAQGLALVGLFFALGRYNPIASFIIEHSGSLSRYPIKFWILVATGCALLAGKAFETILDAGERKAAGLFFGALLGTALLLATGWLVLRYRPEAARAFTGARPEACLWSLGFLGLLIVLAALARRRPSAGGAALLAAHAASQLLFLAPVFASDDSAPYRTAPAALAHVPAGSTTVSASGDDLFRGDGPEASSSWPDERSRWRARRDFFDLQPFAGALWGRRYELNNSAEGLDSFLSACARDAVRTAGDAERVRLLAAWGVDRLLLDRPLDPVAENLVRPLERLSRSGGELSIYEIGRATPRVFLAGHILRAPDMLAAIAFLKNPAFDPRKTAVVPGNGAATEGSGGEVLSLADGPERLVADVAASSASLLVVQRAWLPLYRARVDGRAATPFIANLHRVGVWVPEGRHRVELWVDRRPLAWSLALSVLGSCLLAVLIARANPRAA